MTDHVLVERPDAYPGVQLIRFNRPEKKNAITRQMYARMTEALTAAGTDPAIRAMAFLGTEGCFSAGNDMADFLAFAMGAAWGRGSGFPAGACRRDETDRVRRRRTGDRHRHDHPPPLRPDGLLRPLGVQDPLRRSGARSGSGLEPDRSAHHGPSARLCPCLQPASRLTPPVRARPG